MHSHFGQCLLAVSVVLPLCVALARAGDIEDARYGFRPHYRKLPRLPLPLVSEQSFGKRDHFDREDRDYKPLMFGKRAADYMPPVFGKRGPDYMPPVFG